MKFSLKVSVVFPDPYSGALNHENRKISDKIGAKGVRFRTKIPHSETTDKKDLLVPLFSYSFGKRHFFKETSFL